MLPDYGPTTGYLPPGRHSASWSEVVERFATNAHRTELLGFLENALQLLRQAGCRQVWLNGSFTTDAAQPHDVDVAWDAYGVRPKDLHPLFRSNTSEIRAERSKVFGGDEKLTAAVLDRLAENAVVVVTKGASYRARRRERAGAAAG